MSKIKAIDFANYVEDNRQRLIQHCIENGRNVSNSNNLYDIVTANNDINDTQTFKVEFIDIDGSTLAPTQYVKLGGKATLPDIIPSFDSEYLEFVKWRTSADDSLDNVTRDILVMPEYQVKYDEATGQRPTYLICNFDDNTLSPTFYFIAYTTTNYVNAYIDYGDGIVEQITKTSMPHTYAKKGLYTIKIYGDKYLIGGQGNYGLFSTSGYEYVLLKAYISESLKNISADGFENQKALTNIVFSHSGKSIYKESFAKCSSLISIIIPNDTESISDYAFENCHSLKYIIIPNSVIGIKSYAFSKCYNLDNFIMPNSITSINGSSVFSDCYNLKNIVLSDNLSTIDKGIFENCKCLSNVILPDNITNIPYQMFNNSNLKSITIPNNVTVINTSAFSNCYNLKNINLSNNLNTIDSSAFYSCNSLKSITIPNTISLISSSAFTGCIGLTNIVLPSNFDISLNLQSSPLSDECLVNIANSLKDNNDADVKTLTLSKDKVYGRVTALIYLNSNGERVSKDTEGAIPLIEFIQNKNWTVTFA